MTQITKLADSQIQIISGPEDHGQRLDKVLSQHIEGYSRSTIQQWIKAGLVLRGGNAPKARDTVRSGDTLEITIPPPTVIDHAAQAMQLDVVYEDATILVVNKPAGLVVHPGAGNRDQTLLNGLLHYDPKFEQLARGGIVHRLDKNTSGLMVVARTEAARQHLVEQLSNRSVKRDYLAIVYGALIAGGTVDAPIGRHRTDRVKMAVVQNGKPAISHYRIGEKFRHTTLVKVSLETGRTHQIRVHMASINLPLVGDPVYGKRLHLPKGASDELQTALASFKRQALHAQQLGLTHPSSGETLSWQAPIPTDMQALLAALQQDIELHK